MSIFIQHRSLPISKRVSCLVAAKIMLVDHSVKTRSGVDPWYVCVPCPFCGTIKISEESTHARVGDKWCRILCGWKIRGTGRQVVAR